VIRETEFAFPSKISIGQYIPTGSIIHLLDPRVKLVMGVLLVACAVIVGSAAALMLLFVGVLTGLILSRVQVRLAFASFRVVIPFLVLLAVIQVFAVPQFREGASVLWHWRFLIMTNRSLKSGLLLMGRFIVIVTGLSLFTFTTSTTEFMHGVEHLLRPLQKLRFPAHETALIINISIRFLPILMGDAERILKAQASRGADFGSGRMNFVRRFRRMLPLFVPLFLVSLRHAQELAEAMESRCYVGGAGRTQLIQLHAGRRDYLGLCVAVVAAALSLCMSLTGVDERVIQTVLRVFS
jgi:energy-coupling factor transport system permease protein